MQQDLHPGMIQQMPVPIIDSHAAANIDAMVRKAYRKFDNAIDAENQAILLIEQVIEEGTR
jgi:type I restriction enzyme S subunit